MPRGRKTGEITARRTITDCLTFIRTWVQRNKPSTSDILHFRPRRRDLIEEKEFPSARVCQIAKNKDANISRIVSTCTAPNSESLICLTSQVSCNKRDLHSPEDHLGLVYGGTRLAANPNPRALWVHWSESAGPHFAFFFSATLLKMAPSNNSKAASE